VPELPSSGTATMVVTLNIENHGYDVFEISKTYFSVVAKGIAYKNSDCYVSSPIADTTIPNGGVLEGIIPFTVPGAISDVSMQYTGSGKYNIEWIKG
jgi:hypothetical protein